MTIDWKINPKEQRIAVAAVKYPFRDVELLIQFRHLRRYFVEDGHLFVENWPASDERYMVFAPGHWISIEVEYEAAA